MHKRSFGSYFAELIIVIIGVSVAFWISTIAEKQKSEDLLLNYYQEISSDIEIDIQKLERTVVLNENKQKTLSHALSFYEKPNQYRDSIISYSFLIGNYYFFEPKDITYQSILASGDLKLIHNREIKKQLVRMHEIYHNIDMLQKGFLEALDLNYFPLIVKKVDYSTGKSNDPDFQNNLQIKNYFMYTINELEVHINWYKHAIQNSKKVKETLDLEIGKSKKEED